MRVSGSVHGKIRPDRYIDALRLKWPVPLWPFLSRPASFIPIHFSLGLGSRARVETLLEIRYSDVNKPLINESLLQCSRDLYCQTSFYIRQLTPNKTLSLQPAHLATSIKRMTRLHATGPGLSCPIQPKFRCPSLSDSPKTSYT